MTIRLYVVTDKRNASDYLVCAKTRSAAINYIATKVLTSLSAKPATPVQVLLAGKDGERAIGNEDDLVAIGIGSA